MAKAQESSSMTVTSTAFAEGTKIPGRFTCDGKNISPDLKWTGAPPSTMSYAVISDDPDAPSGDWVHWVIYDLPSMVRNLPEGMPPVEILANGEKHGLNSFGTLGYGGPCPPSGVHRYFFKVYALDVMLNRAPGMTKQELLSAMEGHILAEGQLMGQYQRKP